jgi:hypothetical protein
MNPGRLDLSLLVRRATAMTPERVCRIVLSPVLLGTYRMVVLPNSPDRAGLRVVVLRLARRPRPAALRVAVSAEGLEYEFNAESSLGPAIGSHAAKAVFGGSGGNAVSLMRFAVASAGKVVPQLPPGFECNCAPDDGICLAMCDIARGHGD